MPKLSTLIKMEPKTSSIDVICEANPQHTMRRFVEVSVKNVVTAEPLHKTDDFKDLTGADYALRLRVCIVCFHEFLRDGLNVQQELA